MALTVDLERREVARSWLAQAVEALLMWGYAPEKRSEYTVNVYEDGALVAYQTFLSKRAADRLARGIAADLASDDLKALIVRHKLRFAGAGLHDQ